ncbi:type II toxin-antitoxin system RelE family toxin [Viscerimonas tarda]
MKYMVEITPKADKELKKIPNPSFRLIVDKIDGLEENPRPNGYIELKGFKGVYRVRAGDYRIIYTIMDAIVTVKVVKIAHRKKYTKIYNLIARL